MAMHFILEDITISLPVPYPADKDDRHDAPSYLTAARKAFAAYDIFHEVAEI